MSGFGAIEAGRAFLKVVVDDADVAKGFDRVQSSLNALGQKMQKFGAISAAVGGVIAGPMLASISAASDAQETMSKFTVVFGRQADRMKKWGDDMAVSIGRSKFEIAGFVASFQDLLVPMGMAAEPAAEMSKRLTALAIDLASFNNMSDADVVRDLQAALTGSGEVMKKYGVIVSEAAVKQELLNLQLDPAIASEAEKAQARLNIIMRGTTAAQGDALRTADGFANKMKALKSQLHDASVEIGNAILPAVTSFVSGFLELTKLTTKFVSENPELVAAIAAIGAAAVGVGGSAIALGSAFAGITAAIAAVTAAPVVAGFVALGVAVGAVALAFVDLKEAAETAKKAAMWVVGVDQKALDQFAEFQRVMGLVKRMTTTAGGSTAGGASGVAGTSFGNALLGPMLGLLDPTNREFGHIAQRGATPNVATPGVDPMTKHLAALGLTGHPTSAAGGGSLLLDGIGALGSWIGEQLPDLMDAVGEFFAPTERSFNSLGTFSAAAVGSLGGVDNQILQVNKEQLATLRRIEAKDGAIRAGQ